jgi:hypothetical protein
VWSSTKIIKTILCIIVHSVYYILYALIRKEMDINEHTRLTNFTFRIKIKQRNSAFIAVLHCSHNEHSSIH